MAATDSLYASSPEASPMRSSPRKSATPDYTEKNIYLRFLASNTEAGSVIGKNGSTISDFQSQSRARIQLSRNHEFFPGTSDRIIMVSGAIDEILKAVELIITKLLDEFYAEDGGDAEPKLKVRLIAPNSSCGGIIGKGGATIKSIIEDSRAAIKISPQDTNYMGLNDRLVTLTGTIEELMRAVELILLKLMEDPHYAVSSAVPFPYTSSYNAMYHGPNGGGGKFQNNKEDQSNSVTIGVADEHIGLVVGRGGRNLTEISQMSGARIKISDRGDFMSGTSDRKVTITGSQRAIRTAESMISRKVASATER